ncbi:60S ribosomal protein L5-1 [Triticum urartu]|uniref:60S ribosomal protein L5-1 n=1 Tax=Triticum urartu TaxID=4572 RepID=M7ZT62_TRIUA|nr:60S ribosomal protein L5-1 [Triticum urartu]
MGTPCISYASQPFPSRHSRNKDAEAVQILNARLMILFDRGTLDGGLDIPHSDKRFAGFKKNEKWLDTEIHRNYIYEDHVADCMKSIADEEPEEYQFHFSEYIKKGIAADDMEALYKKVHATIRADPTMAK